MYVMEYHFYLNNVLLLSLTKAGLCQNLYLARKKGGTEYGVERIDLHGQYQVGLGKLSKRRFDVNYFSLFYSFFSRNFCIKN